MRRVPAGSPGRRKAPARPRLRGANRALHDALSQLHEGVPLNWSQVEDDPELITLAQLANRNNWRGQITGPMPSELKNELYGRLDRIIPRPKPKQVRKTPRSLAGFSENVPVLTQVEDEIQPLSQTALPWLGATVAASVVVSLVLWALSSFLVPPRPTFSWIELRQGDKALSKVQRTSSWVLPGCLNFRADDPHMHRTFNLGMANRDQAATSAHFPIQYLPTTLPISPVVTLRLLDISISPCTVQGADPTDPGQMVKLNYSARTGDGKGGLAASPLIVFQAKALPALIDVSAGKWKEVHLGTAHGVYWQGGPYSDYEGTNWIGDVSMLAIEDGDVVTTYIGQVPQGITESVLTTLAQQVQHDKESAGGRTPPTFHWIELWSGNKLLSPNTLPAAYTPPACATPGAPNYGIEHTFYRVDTFGQTQAYTGWPIYTLPPAGNAPFPFTTSVIEGEVRPCTGSQLVSKDPAASVKLRYSVSGDGPNMGAGSEVNLFETKGLRAAIDIGKGTWKEVQLPNAHGILWSGPTYHDPEGSDWLKPVNVLMVEAGDFVLTLVGEVEKGISEELLTGLSEQMHQ